MNANNQAMWRAAGLQGGEAMDKTYIDHPFYPGGYLFFAPDTPHLLKAMKTALCNHSFHLPDSVVQINHLPYNMVGNMQNILRVLISHPTHLTFPLFVCVLSKGDTQAHSKGH